MAIHSSILAWRIPLDRGACRAIVHGVAKSWTQLSEMEKQWKQWEILFSWAPKSLWMVTAAMKKKTLAPWKKSYDQPRQQRHYFANKGPSSQSYGFSSSHIWMWELDYKESWAPKDWSFWTVVLKKTTVWEPLGLQGAPWTARRSNPSILKEIRPEYSLEGLMLKLKL